MTAKRKKISAATNETAIGPSFFGALALALAGAVLLWASAIVFYLCAHPWP